MDAKLRGYLAETLGVFLIVFIGGGAVCASLLNLDEQKHIDFDPETRAVQETRIIKQPRVDLWSIALAEGLVLAVVLPIVFRESKGCLNPAITLTFWVCKRIEWREAALLIGLQLLGSVLAGLALRIIFISADHENVIRLATPHIQKALLDDNGQIGLFTSLPLGILVEAVLTFFLTFAVFGLMIDRRANRFGGIAVGLARCALVVVGYNLTGAAANPARWFGPALWQLTVPGIRSQMPLYDHPVYWVGPIIGALTAGYLYTTFLLPPDQAKESG